MDTTTFETSVGNTYTLVADLSGNKYEKSHMMVVCAQAKKLEISRDPNASQPSHILPQGIQTAVFDNYFPSGKIYAKVSSGTADVTINIW